MPRLQIVQSCVTMLPTIRRGFDNIVPQLPPIALAYHNFSSPVTQKNGPNHNTAIIWESEHLDYIAKTELPATGNYSLLAHIIGNHLPQIRSI